MLRRTQALILGLATTAAVAVVPLVAGQEPSADAAVRKHVTTDYTLLRRAPHSYVIGTAYRNWTVDVHGDQNSGYRWGRIYGDVNSCLWIYSGAVAGDASSGDSCGAATSLPTSTFTNGQIGGSTDDGATVATVAGASCRTWDGSHITGYGNVRPWQATATPSSTVNGRVAIGQTVLWRYVSRDGKWVMIRDQRAGGTDGSGQQSWYFIPRSCLPAHLPG
ncbi:hypothetical protein C8250_002665 [Streptomyces sp. So13.3]|uniref:hypothetical protein n=1 Tax=Streptomyces TaxID=1883 RepID=UPI00110654DA|nr:MULTISPECIES: hypothetical protein [Streptomyces]MCZ4095237.1 hypothetical protein [Streptomyces sp. H39-C1]QNA70977.1 hypothetical protein C8250_002665 [Streptomyces sp. So13.3]